MNTTIELLVAQEVRQLTVELTELQCREKVIVSRLRELNRPQHLDAKQIIADLEAREKTRRASTQPKQHRVFKHHIDQIWPEDTE